MSRKSIITSGDVEGPQASTVDLASTINDVERPDLIVVADATLASPEVLEYAKDLKFMEDMLVIQISETNDPNAENQVAAGVNGEVKYLERGKEHRIARKFVDSLIKREDRIKTVNYKDSNGVDQTRVDKIPALKYGIEIRQDPAGEVGRRWFKHQSKNAW